MIPLKRVREKSGGAENDVFFDKEPESSDGESSIEETADKKKLRIG